MQINHDVNGAQGGNSNIHYYYDNMSYVSFKIMALHFDK